MLFGESDDSFLSKTRQDWKLPWANYWIPLAGLTLLYSLLTGKIGGTDETVGWLMMGAVALANAGWIWGALTIRCPECGVRLFWKAMRQGTPMTWLGWLRSLRKCPVCGSDGARAFENAGAPPK